MQQRNSLIAQIAVAQAIALLFGTASLLAAPSNDSTKVELHSAGQAKSDTDYQYLTNKATVYYKRGNFNRAAQLFADAVNLAQNQGIKDDRMALLLTNLASTYREQQRYEEAEPLFSRAVEIERKQPVKDTRAISYTAQQYAALLRDTDRDVSSDYILASASHGFDSIKGGELPEIKSESSGKFSDENIASRSEFESGGLFSEEHAQPKGSSSIFSTHSSFGSPATISVTAQLRDLAQIERLYADQNPFSNLGDPYGGLAPSGYGSFYTPLVSTYSYFPMGGSAGFGGHSFAGHHGSFAGGHGFGGGHR